MSARRVVTRAVALLTQFNGRTSSSIVTSAVHGCHQFAPASLPARSRILGSYSKRSLTTAGCVSTEERADDVFARAATVLEDEVTAADEPAAQDSISDQAPADAAAPAEKETDDATAAPVRLDPVLEQFNSLWSQYSDVLTQKGFFADRPEQTVPNSKRSEIGAVKRASLQAARERIDILFSLPVDKLVTLGKAELPYVDRKIENAKERLVATFVEGTDLGVGNGGQATTQDLVRMLLCARVACSLDSKRAQDLVAVGSGVTPLKPDFVKAVNAILPDVIAVLDAEPEEEALTKAKAAQEAREAEIAAQPRSQYPERRDNRAGFFRERETGGDFRPGDWLCPECNAQNFARRNECFRCDAGRPEDAARFGGQQRGGDRYVRRDQEPFGERRTFEARAGDWPCPACNANNFARRTECFQCNEARPESAGPVPESRFSSGPRYGQRDNFRDGPRREAPAMKPGDWMCPECNGHNFASRADCFRCNFPRPAEAGPPRGARGPSSGGSSSGWTERDSFKPSVPADLDW